MSASVDRDLLSAVEKAVARGHSESVSAWVNEAWQRKLAQERRLEALAAFVTAYEKEHGEINRARQEVDKILNEARSLVEEARRNEIQKVKRIDERSHQYKTQLDKLRGVQPVQEEVVPAGDLDIEQVKPGDIVYSHLLKKEFTVQVVDARRKEITIAKGPIKMTVPVHTLGRSKRSPVRANVSVSFAKTSNSQLEFDVRGMRLSEFQNLIEKALGDLLSGDVPYLSIIHGHGDGVLKNWLRDYLKRSRDFQAGAPESGNDGETKITLK